MLKRIALDDIPFVLSWAREEISGGRTKLTHPEIPGCLIFDPRAVQLLSFSTADPTQAEITRQGGWRGSNLLQENPILEALQVELSAMYGRTKPANIVDSPFKVFPQLEATYAVVLCIYEGLDGLNQKSWAMLDEESFEKFKDALAALQMEQGNSDKAAEISARSTLMWLTGHGYGRWLIVYQNNQWVEALLVDPTELNFDDDEYEYVSCRVCGLDTSFIYWQYNLQDWMRQLYKVWLAHREQHPDCTGELHSL